MLVLLELNYCNYKDNLDIRIVYVIIVTVKAMPRSKVGFHLFYPERHDALQWI